MFIINYLAIDRNNIGITHTHMHTHTHIHIHTYKLMALGTGQTDFLVFKKNFV
jgi:hypothetical protein